MARASLPCACQFLELDGVANSVVGKMPMHPPRMVHVISTGAGLALALFLLAHKEKRTLTGG